jgi:hypothetical protein
LTIQAAVVGLRAAEIRFAARRISALPSRGDQLGALRCKSIRLHPIQTVEFDVRHDAMISREAAATGGLPRPHAGINRPRA